MDGSRVAVWQESSWSGLGSSLGWAVVKFHSGQEPSWVGCGLVSIWMGLELSCILVGVEVGWIGIELHWVGVELDWAGVEFDWFGVELGWS